MQQYITTIGTTGMKMLPVPPLFRIFHQASTSLAQSIEAKFNGNYTNTHSLGTSKRTGLRGWIPLPRPGSNDFLILAGDPFYKQQMITDFTSLQLKLSKRFSLYLNAVQNQL